MNCFEDLDINIYKSYREKYLPTKIKFLFIGESPPAFKGSEPKAYFYFDNVPKADSLFYTLIKAIYNLDFDKYLHSRPNILTQLASDGYYLIDAVEYPINKTKGWDPVPNSQRIKIIENNRPVFETHLNRLKTQGNIDDGTSTVLIKETVFKSYSNYSLLNIINKQSIGFPRYLKDRTVIDAIRELLGMEPLC